jgi:ABC-type transporter MlaC component
MKQTHRALTMLALSLTLVAATATLALAAPQPTNRIEGQNDRLLRNLQAGQTQRTQAAVTLARSMERNLTPVPADNSIAAQPTPPADTATPGNDVNVAATLLLGLIGGLVGGGAVIAGWTAATRRHRHRPATAT